jgi:formate--tetrahydrofolate ligase
MGKIVVAYSRKGTPVTTEDLEVAGAMTALMHKAIFPNLMQTLEGNPVWVHAGPFANIAIGQSSIVADKLALKLSDYHVTESGFGADIGFEKFWNLKCRLSGLTPNAAVIVATVRALKMHGGVALAGLEKPDAAAVARGLENLAAHVEAATSFKRPVTVAINRFPADTPEELDIVRAFCRETNTGCALSEVFARGGDGGVFLANADGAPNQKAQAQGNPPPLEFVYPDEMPVREKIGAIARRIYGADGVDILPEAERKLELFELTGFGNLPVCMAKTQNSISDDEKKLGRPRGFKITVRDFELAAGAGFIVVLTGQMMRMPALPKVPSAEKIDVNADGVIVGISGV